jgi:hypothetical protein
MMTPADRLFADSGQILDKRDPGYVGTASKAAWPLVALQSCGAAGISRHRIAVP